MAPGISTLTYLLTIKNLATQVHTKTGTSEMPEPQAYGAKSRTNTAASKPNMIAERIYMR